jgi:hypothetical protein
MNEIEKLIVENNKLFKKISDNQDAILRLLNISPNKQIPSDIITKEILTIIGTTPQDWSIGTTSLLGDEKVKYDFPLPWREYDCITPSNKTIVEYFVKKGVKDVSEPGYTQHNQLFIFRKK